MTVSLHKRRIDRAEELARQHPFAAEILGFYVHLARFQQKLHQELKATSRERAEADFFALITADLNKLTAEFGSYLSVIEEHGPKSSAELCRQLRAAGREKWTALLQAAWAAHNPSDTATILATAFLQPYAELVRSRSRLHVAKTAHALCPFCSRKPGLGVLRQKGEGAARSMICSFCLAEWEFRRLVCPGCGEENDRNLSVFSASDFDHIRVESCDSCKTYIKTIDLTKNGRADPVVDELASAPLDLWAREHEYAKLQPNILGI